MRKKSEQQDHVLFILMLYRIDFNIDITIFNTYSHILTGKFTPSSHKVKQKVTSDNRHIHVVYLHVEGRMTIGLYQIHH